MTSESARKEDSEGRPALSPAAGRAEALARALIADFAARRPLGAGSFIVTLYGDAIVPRGGLVWLGNVIAVCTRVGISETLVRTAVSRLVAAGHLVGLRDGRRSFYRLSEASHTAFEAAAAVIYGGPRDDPAEAWSLLVLPEEGLGEAERRALAEQGYGFLGPTLALRARVDEASGPLPSGTLRFDARLLDEADRAVLRTRAVEAWALDALNERYAFFCRRFAPLQAALDGGVALAQPLALAVRLLLVHDYRHIVLEDPGLPAELLPEAWQGRQARRLFATLYALLAQDAEAEIDAAFIDAEGPLSADPRVLEERRAALSDYL